VEADQDESMQVGMGAAEVVHSFNSTPARTSLQLEHVLANTGGSSQMHAQPPAAPSQSQGC